jgi:heptosyltransferase-1
MPSLLIVKTSSLGDVIHMMPAVSDVRRARPDAHISWLVDEAYVPLAELHGGVDEVIPVAWRRWRRNLTSSATWSEMRTFSARLRRRRYDAVIDAQGLIHSGSMARLALGERHGFDSHSIREPLAASLYDVRHAVSRRLPAIERNRRLAAHALGYEFDNTVDYALGASWRYASGPAPYAVFVHATSRPDKTWPVASWVAVGNALGLRGLRVVLPAGSGAERARATQMAGALSGAVAPPTLPLRQTLDVILNASLVIGVDTGLLHLAAALAVPTVAIFTASDPSLTGPTGDGVTAVVGGRYTPPTVDEVLRAADAVLSRAALSSGGEDGDDRIEDFAGVDVARPAVPDVGAGGASALSARR